MDKPKKSKANKLNVEEHAKAAVVDDHSHWAFDVEMHRKIEVEAYLIAEKDGFVGNPEDYWITAEKEIGCAMPRIFINT